MHGAGARCTETNFSEKFGNFLIQYEIQGGEIFWIFWIITLRFEVISDCTMKLLKLPE